MTESNRNAITSPESTEKRKLSDDVVAISQRVKRIREILQVHGQFNIDLDEVDGTGPMRVELAESPVTAKLSESELTVTVGFKFDAMRKNDDPNVTVKNAVTVIATYLLTYEIDPGPELQRPDSLNAFAEVNGRFNATSYWREYLHDSLGRAGLPPYLVPPFDASERLRSLNTPPKRD